MLTNDQMKANRFAKLARGRKIMAKAAETFARGGAVRVRSALTYSDLTAKHAEMLTMDRTGSLYLQRGKRRDCIDFCTVQFSR